MRTTGYWTEGVAVRIRRGRSGLSGMSGLSGLSGLSEGFWRLGGFGSVVKDL
jgi:hypothetical protein